MTLKTPVFRFIMGSPPTPEETLDNEELRARIEASGTLCSVLQTDHIWRQDQAGDVPFDTGRWRVFWKWNRLLLVDCKTATARALYLVKRHFDHRRQKLRDSQRQHQERGWRT